MNIYYFFYRFSYLALIGACFFLIENTLLWAENLCSENENFPRHIAFKEEYLYLQPIFDNDFIGSPNINAQNPFNLQPGGPGKKNKFNYSSGYRLSGYYLNPLPCPLIQGYLSFTYLPAYHRRNICLDSFLDSLLTSTNEVNQAEQSISGSISSRHHLHYSAADLFLTFSIYEECLWNFFIEPGLHYAHMTYKTDLRFSTKNHPFFSEGKVKEKSNSSGFGPQLKFLVICSLHSYFSLKGELRGGLLLSRAKAHFHMHPFILESLSTSSSSTPRLHPLWKIFPFWETKLGLNFSYSFKHYEFEAEIGYEYLTYPNFINRIQFPSNGSSTQADNILSNFDFQGPYASIMISF